MTPQLKTQIITSAHTNILKTIGSKTAESGGLLFGPADNDVITHFVFDKDANTTGASYELNTNYLNPIIDEMLKKHLILKGIIHSHPNGYKSLSAQDKMYFKSQLKHLDIVKLFTPLIFPAIDGTYDFIPYVFHQDGSVETTILELLPDDYQNYIAPPKSEVNTSIVPQTTVKKRFTFRWYFTLLATLLITGIVGLALALLPKVYQYISTFLN